MKIYVDLEDGRFVYLKEWLSNDYTMTKQIDEADVIILGIHKKDVPNNINPSMIISFHPLNVDNNISLNNSETYLKKNAYLTAIGCINQLDVRHKNIVVFGNGRIATYLKNEIKQPITLICRHPKENEKSMDSLDYLEADIIINTIPYHLNLDIDHLNPNVQIIDLASFPYGFDHQLLKDKGFNIELWSGIPGKFFPKEAAQIIYEEVIRCLKG